MEVHGRSQNPEIQEKFRDFCRKNRCMNGQLPIFLEFRHFAFMVCQFSATCRAVTYGKNWQQCHFFGTIQR
jgi:hypothetical protein